MSEQSEQPLRTNAPLEPADVATPPLNPEAATRDILRRAFGEDEEEESPDLEIRAESQDPIPEALEEPASSDDAVAESDTAEEETPAAEPDAAEAPQSLQDLAEKAGLTIEELYKIEVPLGGPDGKSFTLGALKDRWNALDSVEVQVDELEQAQIDFQNANLRARQELQQIVQYLGGEQVVTPEVRAAARDAVLAMQQRENTRLLQIMPEMADPTFRAQADADLLELATRYGFQAADLHAVQDHRLRKLLHDFTVMLKKSDRAAALTAQLPTGETQAPTAAPPRDPNRETKNAVDRARRTGTNRDRLDAVRALLSNTQ